MENTRYAGSTGPLRFGPFPFPFCFWTSKVSFTLESPHERGPKTIIDIFNVESLLMSNASAVIFVKKKKQAFPLVHQRTTTHKTPNPCTTAPLSQIPSVYKHFACEMIRSAQELYAIEKMAAAGMGKKENRDHAGPAADDDNAVAVPLEDTAQDTA